MLRVEALLRYSFGDDETQLDTYAWFFNNSQRTSADTVGQREPNPNDLYDMHGNVREWVFDRHSDSTYTGVTQSDPIGVLSGINRVLRGGSYVSTESNLRSASREYKILTIEVALLVFDWY